MTQQPNPPLGGDEAKAYGSSASRIPTEGQPISNARLAANLQALTIALRMGGLEGLRSGTVKIGGERGRSE